MNKKLWIGVAVVVILPVAYWLISPIWRTKTLDETLPIGNVDTVPAIALVAPETPMPSPVAPAAQPKDNLPLMDAVKKMEFEKQTLEMKDKIMLKKEPMPIPANSPTIINRANMVASAHDVSGQALLVKSGSDTYLRFENLKTINGPDLRIYLSAGLDVNDAIDLGAIRATEGNVNYALPAGTDITKYKNALIWCRAFGVLFSYGRL